MPDLSSVGDQFVRQTEIGLRQGRAVRRREFLRCVPATAAVGGALSWTDLLSAQAGSLRQRGKSCILLWMQGGPSQFETFSPLIGHEHGGETEAIETVVPGIQIASHLPQVADVMDELCVIRSMTSKEGSHPRAQFLMHSGYLPNPSVRHPSFGANVMDQLADAAAELPSYVRIGRVGSNLGGGLLGVSHDPFVLSDATRPPDNTRLTTAERRFKRRMKFRNELDENFGRSGSTLEAGEHDQLYDRAKRMVLSSDMSVFDIEREPKSVREAYGDSQFGAGCLLARRLVESGATFVEVTLNGWDTHDDNFNRVRSLCGQLDQPYAALLRDLRRRGRLDDTLVIWMGEFGRTPRINARGGRDHFPSAFNVALAGAGVRGGQVIGSTTSDGYEVAERPVSVPDLFQTFCHALGIDPNAENTSATGRPIKIVEGGEVVPEVFA
ncbi:MAG: DUF1501 domain-containing protein [Planctomycetota bacterium]